MRLNICIIFSLLLSCTTVSAQFLVTEDFTNFADGSPVENAENNTKPDVGEWVFVEESSGATVPSIINEQLLYPDYIFSGKGKTMSLTPNNGIGNLAFCLSNTFLPYPCQPQGGFVEGSNEFYTAFILNLSNTTASEVQEIFSYYQRETGLKMGAIFYKLSSDKNTVAFSFQKNLNSPSSSWTKYYDKTKSLLLVVKYGHVCINEKYLGHAEFEMFINPNPKKTESENNSLKISAFGNNVGYDADLRYISFRQSGQTTMKVAGIRIANSFEQVLSGPDYNSIGNTSETEFIFYIKGNNLYPSKDVNGKLSIYNMASLLVSSYNIEGRSPIETKLDPGAYILLYEDVDGAKYTQKILIY